MFDTIRMRGKTWQVAHELFLVIAPLAPQALETGDFGIVEPIL